MENSTPLPKPNKLVAAAIANPHFVVVSCLFVIILGLLALFTLPKDLLPAANLPAVQILSFYPGMPVSNVEKNLTARIERYTGQAIGIINQESESLVGVSVVKNFFGANTDLNTAISQTTSLVMSVLRHLPPGTQPPLILPFDPTAAVPLVLVAVNSNLSIEKTYDIARYDVRNAVQAVPGAMAPTVMGGVQRQVVIYLDPKKLQQYNFSPLSVLQIFSQLNTFIPGGDIKIGNNDYQIISNGLVNDIDEMNNFPLRAENGVPIYLKDVGRATDAGQIQTNYVMIDGKQEVYVPVYRQPGGNSLTVVDQVRTAMATLQKQLHGVTLTLVADQSVFIRHAIDSITEEAVLGGGLAALMIFLFLSNHRASLGIFLSLPLSILIAFMGLSATGQTINAMTLGGLALSIGVLVDNSIVMLENISKKLETGILAKQAALLGASEVAMPVLASTLATLVVFFPVIFLVGIVKVLFSALAKAVMFAMLGSFLVAMTVMPLFAAHFLKPNDHHQTARFFLWTQHLMQYLTEFYGNLLARALNYRKSVLWGVGLIFMLGVAIAPLIGTELFPRADAGNFIVKLRLASGTRIEQTTDFSQQIEQKLRTWIPSHDLKMIITNTGVYYGYSAAFTPNTGPQDMFFDIELTEDRQHTSQYYAKIIREHMQKEFPNVEFGVQLGGLLSSAINGGIRAPISIQIQGPELKRSYAIAQQLLSQIKKLPGAVDARIQERFDAPMIKVDINRQQAMDVGITPENIIKNIASAVTGSTAFDSDNIWVDPATGIDYLMGVQFPEQQAATFQQLSTIPIQAQDRERTAPLNQLATLSLTKGPTEINHVNYQPIINIYLDAEGRDIGGLSNDVIKIIKHAAIEPDYAVNIRGEISEMNSAVDSLGGGFILAAALVYLILVIQFRSFLLPLIIMISVPLGLVGIVFMLVATHTYFSIQAAIGAIFMIGIAVANGVLLIEFILHHARNPGDLNTNIVAGAKERLRPILMTSLAAILGLIPMAIGLGHGSEANIPLGRAVIGGQFFAALLTLFVVPVLFRCLAPYLHKKSAVLP